MRKRALKKIACAIGAAVMAVSVAAATPANTVRASEIAQETAQESEVQDAVSQSEQELREKVVRDYYENGAAELADSSTDGIKTTSDGVYKYRVLSEAYKMAEIVSPVQGKFTFVKQDNKIVLEIPEVLDDEYTVVSLGAKAYSSIILATDIIIPDTVVRIGSNCFTKCTDASWIDIPTSVSMIGEHAFAYTPWLLRQREVRPDRLVIVNDILVDGRECTGNVVIPSGVTELADWAFNGNISLNEAVDYYRGSNTQ